MYITVYVYVCSDVQVVVVAHFAFCSVLVLAGLYAVGAVFK